MKNKRLQNVKLGKSSLNFFLSSDADESVFHEIFTDRDYKILDENIRMAKSCILDIGAHIGLFSVYAAVLNPTVKIFSFEPSQENFSLMKENLRMNQVKNVVSKNVAIGGNTGLKNLYLSCDSHNHSFVKYVENMKETKVPVFSLENVFSKLVFKSGFPKCDLVKMDCEGAEFEILASCSKDLLKKIDVFYIEYHEYLPEMRKEILKKILECNGFSVRITKSSYDNRMGFVLAKR